MSGSATDGILPDEISYTEAGRLARHGDSQIRSSLAGRPDIPEEVLYFLAEDEASDVRREVAQNDRAPRHADLLLASDSDPSVRTDLATKLCRLVPGLDPETQEKLYQLTEQSLLILAWDQLLRVREILSEALCSVASAPQTVIECLARDATLSVAAPVLRSSPLLNDDLLLEIINSGPIRGALGAIADRDGLKAPLADAIFSAGDTAATARLLANPSAQIREETLDMIVAAAPPIPDWHDPLVRRPRLSGRVVRHIAGFVAANLLESLQRRTDLDQETLDEIAEIVEQRLDEPAPERTVDAPVDGDPDWADRDPVSRRRAPVDPDWADEDAVQETAADRAQAMLKAGTLDESALADALAEGDRAFAIAAFAVKVELPESVLSRTIAMRNGKGIVALSWKAGFSMRFAVRAQIQLAGIAPDETVRPTDSGEYPMDRQELLWQLGFISGEGN